MAVFNDGHPSKAEESTDLSVEGREIEVRELQPEKALFPMEVTPSARVTVVRDSVRTAGNKDSNLLSANPKMAVFSDGHPSKAEESTDLSVEGREIEVRELQSEKAKSPTEVTPSGMVTEVKEEQP
jgi:hypothetical protein